MQELQDSRPRVIVSLDHVRAPQLLFSYISSIQMKKSMHSHDTGFNYQPEQIELPKQWDYLSKRLSEVERGLTLMEMRHLGLEKKFNLHAHEVTKVQVEFSEDLSNMKTLRSDPNYIREIASDAISQLKKDLQDSNAQRFHNFESQTNLALFEVKDSVDMKIKGVFEQARTYIDKAVSELKQLLKKYVKDHNEIETKLQRVTFGQNSPVSQIKPSSHAKNSKSSHKFFSNQPAAVSHEKSTFSEKCSNQWPDHSSSTSRVNYLREKLKEFQKINKKYENSQGVTENPTELMQKMKSYKDYLEQSESELEPSNLFSGQNDLGRRPPKKGYGHF